MKREKEETLIKKREEAERKARRGEIDPTHEFTFHIISQVRSIILKLTSTLFHQLSTMNRHEILQQMFTDPLMLDDLDYLYKNEMARKVLFFYQPKEDSKYVAPKKSDKKDPRARKNAGLAAMQEKDTSAASASQKLLFTTDATGVALTGLCMYFIRLTTKRALGEETFQREILTGVISAAASENVIWYLERIISTIFIPLLNTSRADDKENEKLLKYKVRKELLPCLRSFTSCLRVAETVWSQGLLIEDFPQESYTIRNLDDSWALLDTEDGQRRFEEAVRGWMKSIYELLLESEQLRLETDDAGPQVCT